MSIGDLLSGFTGCLEAVGISTARLDVLILLEDATGKDRAWLLANTETEIKQPVLLKLMSQIERRARHEPLAYIRGKSEFYGREFIINSHTLQPRPETETMIDILKQVINKDDVVQIIDVGTGSGCLAITAKLELPNAKVYATDIDDKCIKTARQNARRWRAQISFTKGDLLQSIPSTIYHLPSTILANLPYVPDNHTINPAAMHEPKSAIFGGTDGLDLYRRLFNHLQDLSNKPCYVLTESLSPQHDELTKIALSKGYKHLKTDDFIQLFALP